MTTRDGDDQPEGQQEGEQEGEQEGQQEGQVSELAVAGGEPEPISSGDSVAGQPDDESGDVQEGAIGPDAIPVDETGEHPHRT